MTAKKAHTDTMILLVVPLGFWTGTELLNTRPQRSHIAFPMVKEGPWGAANDRKIRSAFSQDAHLSVFTNYAVASGNIEGCQWVDMHHSVPSLPQNQSHETPFFL